jgi:Flp pilus assembly protein TadB
VSATALLAASTAAGACGCVAAGYRAMVCSGPAHRMQGTVEVVTRTRPRGGRRDRKRQVSAWRGEIPQFLDLLAAGSTAGLSAEISFRQAASCLHGPLGGDLEDVMRSVDLGVPWRTALAGYVERTGDPDLATSPGPSARRGGLQLSSAHGRHPFACSSRSCS